MRQIPFLAFALSALVPGLVWSYWADDPGSLKYSIPIAYLGTAAFAIPQYLLVTKYWRVSMISSCLCGSITGLLTWIATYLIYTAIWDDDVFKAGLAVVLGFMAFVGLGALAGFVFWLMHRWQRSER
ncbi:hypothetical protein ACV22X_30775 [Burkholderia orbicola]|uniref:hypothetical protein n=1 Tax=Burkholderia cepacia complex TaxID=87882 RepID=UPI0009811020|nr:hypothetical protein [Burkholderia cenocepacia]AQQ25350.1 hypothetical protein A8E88_06490 [Burkholderia cenocepacia]ONV83825.1 hypothetical protein A8E89_27620 [Burkholderia cenocepacia]ONW04510.1 hypothetical protein A8E94_32385 [Burkholderia cenocepacia]ONW26526.1 hypothetical protein A8E90_00550 [Burkholderia cenocepacia]ONW32208.1 hypothetical protein A8E99_33000 [Burkholderia cenocepacia]